MNQQDPASADETNLVESTESDSSTESRERHSWRLVNQTILAIAQLLIAIAALLALVLQGNGGPA